MEVVVECSIGAGVVVVVVVVVVAVVVIEDAVGFVGVGIVELDEEETEFGVGLGFEWRRSVDGPPFGRVCDIVLMSRDEVRETKSGLIARGWGCWCDDCCC